MAAIARMLSRVSGTEVEVEILKTVAIFCGVGLFVALLLATYGLNLSPEPFKPLPDQHVWRVSVA